MRADPSPSSIEGSAAAVARAMWDLWHKDHEIRTAFINTRPSTCGVSYGEHFVLQTFKAKRPGNRFVEKQRNTIQQSRIVGV